MKDQYTSKKPLNKGQIWMNWKKSDYNGNLQVYIDNFQKFLFKLDSINIKVPLEIFSYCILGKLIEDTKLSQLIDVLTMNKEIIERPNLILNQLQEYVNHLNTKSKDKPLNPLALVSVSDHPYKITYYCANGHHNIKCTTHTKEECYVEHPHLRPPRQGNKRKLATSNKTTQPLHLSSAESLAIFSSEPSSHQILAVDCGTTHHMLNDERSFTKISNSNYLKVAIGDPQSSLLSKGVGKVLIICDGRRLLLEDCLFVPKLKCNLIMVIIPKDHLDWKLGPNRSTEILFGYENDISAYQVLQFSNFRILISHYVTFDETKFPSLCKPANTKLFPISLPSQPSEAVAVDETCTVALVSNNESLTEENLPIQTGVVDEFQPVPALAVVDKIYTDVSSEDGNEIPAISGIRIIGLLHPTLILSNLKTDNILP
ncbi:hypothetical protein O181_064281 [Austropuccinia psidii MF-1]|uniref:Retrovirus-related Pol polyprotein from transposon TNT 1-94-like beta-barrel domain-containing protein n=1 Tax=Austropuccinia psidii MF-1 TaxID=1389203 RepID=A0A9Q3ELN0_9BASI|nr:hypothetical protein [Austropuccinia psidii MF-1]